jgi:hypothetical protein
MRHQGDITTAVPAYMAAFLAARLPDMV